MTTEAHLLAVLTAITEGDIGQQTRAIFRAYVHLQLVLGVEAIEPNTRLDNSPQTV